MSALDALLGQVWSEGLEVELGGGLDFRSGLRAVYNASTRRVEVTASGGVTDHGSLTGLDDDDHTQYARVDGTRAFTATQSGTQFRATDGATQFDLKSQNNATGTLAGSGGNATTDIAVTSGSVQRIHAYALADDGTSLWVKELFVYAVNRSGTVTIIAERVLDEAGTLGDMTFAASVSGTNVRLTVTNTGAGAVDYRLRAHHLEEALP